MEVQTFFLSKDIAKIIVTGAEGKNNYCTHLLLPDHSPPAVIFLVAQSLPAILIQGNVIPKPVIVTAHAGG